jgi:hypothetical protein
MVNEDIEFVDAFKVFMQGEGRTDKYYDFIGICEKNGIQDVPRTVDKMIMFDYLIRNTDRNTGNYGILRNSETLEWAKVAPLFDHGNALWYDVSNIENISAKGKSRCKSFWGTNEENIEHITHKDWYDGDKIKESAYVMEEILGSNGKMEKERVQKIVSVYKERVQDMEQVLSQGR